jgi:hypothetical protein
MTPEEFQSIYPHVLAWIRETLADHANKAQTVASRGFTRLPLYFSGELLASTKFVALERLPMLPLSALGLIGSRNSSAVISMALHISILSS